ncbi:hypothetical protein [Umezawaea sp. Da 62-37]|uniref:hypothetical protein n=1 Tax=Umezawaea sp. Da 62-37 TaxID=3075927 RepID=UPI0028F6C258|nr:hypothetical protein [Umezawaea sp. Da 62-37]WNV87649.1 hypothetical protein RM788_04935 [Umezawaea sp. Da 62-37]
MTRRITTATSLGASTLSRPVVISLRPRFADAILSGGKTVELRRHRMAAPLGTLLIIYCSAPVMAVVGTVLLEERDTDTPTALWRRYRDHMGLSRAEFREYLSGLAMATALTLRDAQPLKAPLPLRDLRRDGLFQPPQSFRYLSPADPAALQDLLGDSSRTPRSSRV